MVSSTHRRPRPPPSIMSIRNLLLCLGASSQLAHAGPYPKDDLHDVLGSGFLVDRSCATYCGVDNQYCCAQGQACTTNAGIAGCTDTALGGGFGIYTTTWTETDTYTSTISSYYPATTGDNGADCVPPAGSGQIACGPICCASWQYCAANGQCGGGPGPGAGATTTEAAGGGGGGMLPTTITTSGTTITTQYSAPYRVTSGTTGTGTTTGTMESATATGSGNGTAVTTGGDGLSGGAIAGIVIGVIAGVVILLAICACCIMRGLWHGLLAIFGLGPGRKRKSRSRDRETIIVEEERYRRGGSAAAHSRRDTHGGWFAARPPRSAAGSRRASGVASGVSEKKRESGNAGWWGAGALGTMGLLLGLRRDKKRKEQAKRTSRPRSDVSSSYFSDSYTASSPSEFSSDYTYSSVYTRPPQSHAPVPAHRGPPTVYSASGAGRERDDYFKSNVPPDYAGSASSGGRTRDTRRSRRTETTRISRAPSRR